MTITAGASAAVAVASALLALLAAGAVDRLLHPRGDPRQIQRLLEEVSELRARLDGADGAGSGRALQQQGGCDLPDGFTYASDFGVVGDAIADDGPALQAAIDSAASDEGAGGIVVLPRGTFRIDEPLVVPAGVTVQGQGYGSSPLAIQFDAGASTIAYCGEDHAVRLDGHGAGLRDLAVYDWPYTGCDGVRAAGGVLVDADGRGVESVVVSNVLIYYFVGGRGLSLVAKNQGGIAYGNFQNVRVRHAKTGIYLGAEDGSFVK